MKKLCVNCREEIEGEVYEFEGEYYCECCYDELFTTCDDCGKVVYRDSTYWVEDKEMVICDDCVDSYFICEDCGNCYSNGTYIEHHGYVCDRCFHNGEYCYCRDCDGYYRDCDMNYCEHDDEYYCDDCYSNHCDDDLLYEYHDFDDWELFRGKNEDRESVPYYIGKEIELEPKGYSNLSDVVETMHLYLNAVGMEDGSLNSGSVEVVTHPESWEYLQEKKEDYKAFFENMEKLEYGDAGHTGLHFHITRPSDDVIARIIVIIESFKEEIQKLSRRNGDFHWSKFLTDSVDDNVEKLKYKSTKFLKDKYIKSYHDRYLALNLCNSRTIEFRFFKGANNFEEFWGALQFIHNLMEIALDETRELNTITWNELIKGEELESQAQKLGVFGIDKKVEDTTDILDKIEKAKEETKEQIRKTLKNFVRYVTRNMKNEKLNIASSADLDNIAKSSKEFVNNLTIELNYLQELSQLYNNLEYLSIRGIKNNVLDLKNKIEYNNKYYNKDNKYNNYFKQIDKALKVYESEVEA